MTHPSHTVARAATLVFTAHATPLAVPPGDRVTPFPKEKIHGYPDRKPSA
jgi:hypothetical protein